MTVQTPALERVLEHFRLEHLIYSASIKTLHVSVVLATGEGMP